MLLEKVDKICLLGGIVFTFYKARGLAVGSSLVEVWPAHSLQAPVWGATAAELFST